LFLNSLHFNNSHKISIKF